MKNKFVLIDINFGNFIIIYVWLYQIIFWYICLNFMKYIWGFFMKYLREKVRINIYVCVFLLVYFILYSIVINYKLYV